MEFHISVKFETGMRGTLKDEKIRVTQRTQEKPMKYYLLIYSMEQSPS